MNCKFEQFVNLYFFFKSFSLILKQMYFVNSIRNRIICFNMVWFFWFALVYKRLFSPHVIFALLHLQTLVPSLEFKDTLGYQRNNLLHWYLPSLKFARWQKIWRKKWRKNGDEYFPVYSTSIYHSSNLLTYIYVHACVCANYWRCCL